MEGLVICINNPFSARFSVNVTSAVKRIVLIQFQFSRHTMQSLRTLTTFDCLGSGRAMMKI